MRIISGTARGLKLKAPRGTATRPTADRIKESLFNILTCMIDFDGRRVLDLFAGSGALGLESLSRGATHATFIDRNSINCIIDNAKRAHFNNITALAGDAFRLIERFNNQQFDIIFADPPYHFDLAQRTIEIVDRNDLLAGDGLLIVELGADEQISSTLSRLERIRRVDYGRTTAIEIYRRQQ